MGNFEPDTALASYEKARRHYAQLAATGEVPVREAGLVELYASNVHSVRGNGGPAVQHSREALRIAQQILRAHPQDQTAQSDVAVATGQLASVLHNSGNEAESVEYFKRTAVLREQILAVDPENVRARERLALAKGREGTILARASDFAGALAALQRSISLYEGLQSAGQLAATMEVDYAEVLGHLADYYQRTSDAPAACGALRRALDILEAADRRLALTGFRKRQMEYVRTEIAKCG
jgi:tetratricopeptide (TPR) repeat protein